jgi:hypothetical protein
MRETGLTLDHLAHPRELTATMNRGEIRSVITRGNTMNARWLRPLCASVLALTSLLAHAQYSWIDDKGMRVFSDRPAPPGTPPERILKAPRGLESTAIPAPRPTPDGAQPVIPEWKKQDAGFRQRMAERDAEAARGRTIAVVGAPAPAAARQTLNTNCDWARRQNAQLATGSVQTGKGESVALSWLARQSAQNEVGKTLRGC